jgi:copper chaperone NosL
MTNLYQRFYASLMNPLTASARLLLVLLLIPLALSLMLPLWNIHMVAPQYPAGLDLDIYAHTVTGDVQEINTLNHYIGMAPIDRTELSDLNWIPFAIGALFLLTLRVAALGTVRWLIDLTVLFAYFSAFSLGRFVFKLYAYGHNLDPRAPFKVEPFTPAIFGTKQIANFTTTALPGGATLLIGVFAAGLLGLTLWQLSRAIRSQPAQR